MGWPAIGCLGMGLLVGAAADDAPPLQDAAAIVTPVAPVRIGARGELSVTIQDTPHPGTPIELWLSSDDIELPENRLGREDIVDPQAERPRLRGRFVAPTEAGSYVVTGFIRYVTCGPRWCRARTGEVRWAIDVKKTKD